MKCILPMNFLAEIWLENVWWEALLSDSRQQILAQENERYLFEHFTVTVINTCKSNLQKCCYTIGKLFRDSCNID